MGTDRDSGRDYMRAYIHGQEKLVMTGVADMAQERIEATREIVGAQGTKSHRAIGGLT